jgi:hypothetical protein
MLNQFVLRCGTLKFACRGGQSEDQEQPEEQEENENNENNKDIEDNHDNKGQNCKVAGRKKEERGGGERERERERDREREGWDNTATFRVSPTIVERNAAKCFLLAHEES